MSAIGFWAISVAIAVSYVVSAVKAASERRKARSQTMGGLLRQTGISHGVRTVAFARRKVNPLSGPAERRP